MDGERGLALGAAGWEVRGGAAAASQGLCRFTLPWESEGEGHTQKQTTGGVGFSANENSHEKGIHPFKSPPPPNAASLGAKPCELWREQ